MPRDQFAEFLADIVRAIKPDGRGVTVVGDYAQGWIRRLRLGSGPPSVTPFAEGAGPLDLQVAPNGNVAYTAAEALSSNGRVAEIRYCPVNCGPVARLSAVACLR